MDENAKRSLDKVRHRMQKKKWLETAPLLEFLEYRLSEAMEDWRYHRDPKDAIKDCLDRVQKEMGRPTEIDLGFSKIQIRIDPTLSEEQFRFEQPMFLGGRSTQEKIRERVRRFLGDQQ